jgi:two-component system cell cycle sensor histidine kinase/response regulator CckA
MGIPLRVLMIEDSEDDAALAVRELKRAGYDIAFTRVDNPNALRSALSAEEWDIVVSDFSMPLFSGTDALKLVRATSEVPFIFVSGTMGEDVAVAALKDGAQDYLIKTHLKRLVPAVQRELREAEERRQRKRMEQHIQQLQKFEAIGRLAGGIAHDFNNAIGAILGWAEMGYQEAQQGTSFHDRFEKIRDQAKWAGRLTSQLLAFARRQVLQPRKINLNTLVEESMNLLHRIIGEQIEVRIRAAEDLHVTEADPTQIEQALMNLCLNARDAMSSAGTLTIETRNVEIGEEYCRHHGYGRPGNYVMLAVSDTGVGMDNATLVRVFEPFFTTKEMGRGTGLGLATVYGVVKQHGGFIDTYSELGNGSVFRLYFPSASGVAAAREPQPENGSPRGSETILLADDHDGLRESAKEMLEGLGYRVIPAGNGLEAVQLFKANTDKIDLVILDVVMPSLTGPEAYSQISAIRSGIKVIFTSGYSAESTLLKTAIEKGSPILQKPYGLRSLSQTIRSTLDLDASTRSVSTNHIDR